MPPVCGENPSVGETFHVGRRSRFVLPGPKKRGRFTCRNVRKGADAHQGPVRDGNVN